MVTLSEPSGLYGDANHAHAALIQALASAHIGLVALPDREHSRTPGMPLRTLEVLAAHLLRWPSGGAGTSREALLSHLALLVRQLLMAQAVTLLLADAARERYKVVREAESGAWLSGADSIALTATPLPLMVTRGAGLMVHRSSVKRPLDRTIRSLVGQGPALLLPIGTDGAAQAILIAHLAKAPHDGESLLALLLVRRAGALLAGEVRGSSATTIRWLSDPAHADSSGLRVMSLSQRELEVARLLAAGLRNKEIAAHLSIREKTVKFHLGRIYGKLGVQSRTEALLALFQGGTILRSPEG